MTTALLTADRLFDGITKEFPLTRREPECPARQQLRKLGSNHIGGWSGVV